MIAMWRKSFPYSTPNLKYLRTNVEKETIMRGIRLEDMKPLYEADFSICSEIGIANIPWELVLLSKISNVTHLRLAG
jgi:hypothetical protein